MRARYGARSWQPFEARSSERLRRRHFDRAVIGPVFQLDAQLPALPARAIEHGIADPHLGGAVDDLGSVIGLARGKDRETDADAGADMARRAAGDADPDAGPRAAVGAVGLAVALDVIGRGLGP